MQTYPLPSPSLLATDSIDVSEVESSNSNPIQGQHIRLPDSTESSSVSRSSQIQRNTSIPSSTGKLLARIEGNIKTLQAMRDAAVEVMKDPKAKLKGNEQQRIDKLSRQLDRIVDLHAKFSKAAQSQHKSSSDPTLSRLASSAISMTGTGIISLNSAVNNEVRQFVSTFGTRHMDQMLEHIDDSKVITRIEAAQSEALKIGWSRMRFDHYLPHLRSIQNEHNGDLDESIQMSQTNQSFLDNYAQSTLEQSEPHWQNQLASTVLNTLSSGLSLVNIHMEQNLSPREQFAQIDTHLKGIVNAKLNETGDELEILTNPGSARSHSLTELALLVQTKLNELKDNPKAEFAFKLLLSGSEDNPYIKVSKSESNSSYSVTLTEKAEQEVSGITEKRKQLEQQIHSQMEDTFSQRDPFLNKLQNHRLLSALKHEMGDYADTGDWDSFRHYAEKAGVTSEFMAQKFGEYLSIAGDYAYDSSPESIQYFLTASKESAQQISAQFKGLAGTMVKNTTQAVVGKGIELGVSLLTLDISRLVGQQNMDALAQLATNTGQNINALGYGLAQYAQSTGQRIDDACPEFVQAITHTTASTISDISQQVVDSDPVQITKLALEEVLDTSKSIASKALMVRNVAVGLNNLSGGRLPTWMGNIAGSLSGVTGQFVANKVVDVMQQGYEAVTSVSVKDELRDVGSHTLDTMEHYLANPQRFSEAQQEAQETWGDLFDISVRQGRTTAARVKPGLVDRSPQAIIDNLNKKLEQFREQGNNAGIMALYRACDNLDFVDIDGTWFGKGKIKHSANSHISESISLDQLVEHSTPMQKLKESSRVLAREHDLLSIKHFASRQLNELAAQKIKNLELDQINPFVSSNHAELTALKAEKLQYCQMAIASTDSKKEMLSILEASAQDIEQMAEALKQKPGKTPVQIRDIAIKISRLD
ncbi:hypothetical protein [Thalassomonas sp. RHCl1]|uniref:hypothetical protein n=1 Tax=Thalassomonas sp. RHCl1 TaxID=2995320 RepID=UPI00248B6DDE|nr:hypothetical protein [Thalassomonas sp. RHCl1]